MLVLSNQAIPLIHTPEQEARWLDNHLRKPTHYLNLYH